MIAEPVLVDFLQTVDLEVECAVFTEGALVVTVVSHAFGTSCNVRFAACLGYHVLDEGDLLEFWPECSRPNGWLFRIKGGGWFEQESQRPGFLSRVTQLGIHEYFIAGENTCVNVLSWEAPEVTACVP